MKKSLLFIVFAIAMSVGMAQTVTTVHDVQVVSPSELANCNDSSAFIGQTVTVAGIVIHDGNLTEVASGSVTGGCRPGVHIIDTTSNGVGGNFNGIQIHGVEAANQSNPITSIHSLVAGDYVEITGVVGRFSGETQIYPLNDAAVNVLPNPINAPQPIAVSVGDLNDGNRVNQLPTGEQYEGSLVMLNNVTVTAVNFFSGGSRVSIDVTDAQGNTINVSDRFLVQKLPSYTSVNPSSPSSNGSFTAPPVGLVYDTLIGIILHSENGCTGANGRGYEINPFDPSHYIVGVTPPAISDIGRFPSVPTDADAPVISAKIIDFDGTITSAKVMYTDNIPGAMYTPVNMTLKPGSTDEFEATIPAFADGSMIGYYIEATDNDGNVTQMPSTPSSQTNPNFMVYHVRNNGLTIQDVQKVLDLDNDASYYTGDTVTVTGVVAASAKDFDLGYVYIQQLGVDEWAGLPLVGNSDLVLLLRTEEVTVTGIIEENFGMTRMQVLNVTKTGAVKANEVTYFDPSDAALHQGANMEKYEGMLMGMANTSGGLFMIDEDAGFGDYRIGSSASATESTRVLAGRQSSSSYSSLWVSLVSDGSYYSNDGQMEVDTVITTATMEMDTLIGMMYYSFSNYRVMPRNNDDIVNLSDNGVAIVLDTTNLQLPDTTTSVAEVNGMKIETVIYPNPASSNITISVNGFDSQVAAEIYDLSGRLVTRNIFAQNGQLSVLDVQNGVYMVRVQDMNGNILSVEKLVIQK